MASTANVLNNITNGLNVALTLESVGLPLVVGTIKGIKKIIDENNVATEDYEVVLTVSKQQMADADAKNQATIDMVNAELARLGEKPL